jgi:hypothetical protein
MKPGDFEKLMQALREKELEQSRTFRTWVRVILHGLVAGALALALVLIVEELAF